ncbi:MAG: helix-turn-helix domain-containing protein [Desulfovibrionaceae bacterium]|nr:helix-turn-helix domain-containing protein [Desulfovibrionaceae bacterium]
MGTQTIQVDKLMELGALLKEKRCSLGLEREEIALKIKVSTKTLYALEEALVDSLPQPIFAKGLIRSYAQTLGIDPASIQELIAASLSISTLDNINPALSASAREQSITINQTSNTKAFAVFIPIMLLLIGGLGFGAYRLLGTEIKALLRGEETELPAENGTDHGLTPAVPPAQEQPPPQSNATPIQLAALDMPQNAPDTQIVPAAAPPAEADFPPSLSRQSNTRPNSPIPAGNKRVVLFAKAECWVGAIFDDTGERSFVLEPGQSFALDFRNKLKLTLGNSGVIEMSYNGQPYSLNGRFREAMVINLPPQ